MNILDITIITILILATARGLFKGLFREFLSLGSIAVAIFLAYRCHGYLEPYLAQYLDGETTTMAASYLAIFLGTVLLAWLLGHLFKKATDESIAGNIDTALGGVLGFLEGVLVSLVLVLMLGTFLSSADFYKESSLTPRLIPATSLVADFLPKALVDAVKESGNELPVSPTDNPDE